MPGLQARSPVGGVQKATTHSCVSPSLPPFPSLKINNKIFKRLKCIFKYVTTCAPWDKRMSPAMSSSGSLLVLDPYADEICRTRFSDVKLAPRTLPRHSPLLQALVSQHTGLQEGRQKVKSNQTPVPWGSVSGDSLAPVSGQ